jgi:hypothetical protein
MRVRVVNANGLSQRGTGFAPTRCQARFTARRLKALRCMGAAPRQPGLVMRRVLQQRLCFTYRLHSRICVHDLSRLYSMVGVVRNQSMLST